MQQFKIGESGIKKFKKRYLAIIIPMVVVFIGIMAATTMRTADPAGTGNTFLFVIPIVAAYFAFTFYRSFRKQMKILKSYSLTVTDGEITREQLDTPPLTISFMAVKEIVKTKKGVYFVRGLDRTEVILIPNLIDNPGELEERLQALAPISTKSTEPFYRKYSALIFLLLGIGLLIGTGAATNPAIAGICCGLLDALLIWGFIEINRNTNLPRSVRRLRWFMLFLLIIFTLSTIGRLTGLSAPQQGAFH